MSDERLPRNARDIIDRLGPAVTLRLIRALGGTTIPVPMRLTPVGEARYRRLCDMIGEDAAKALCREYAGTNLYIPTCRQAAADERDAALIRDRDAMARAGLSEREIVTGLALNIIFPIGMFGACFTVSRKGKLLFFRYNGKGGCYDRSPPISPADICRLS